MTSHLPVEGGIKMEASKRQKRAGYVSRESSIERGIERGA